MVIVPPPPDPELGFAQYLYRQHEYFRAVGEFERWRFDHPTDPQVPVIRLEIARCYLNAERFEQARDRFSELQDDAAVGPLARFGLGRSDEGLGDWRSAARAFTALQLDPPLRASALAHLGLLDAEHGHWSQAVSRFSEASATGSQKIAVRFLAQPRASGLMTGLLSALIPGAGQCFVGRYSDGLTSLLMTGAWVGASAYYAQRGNVPVSVGLGALGAGFWGSGVYGAVGAARDVNREREAQALAALRQSVTSLDPPETP